MNRISDYEIIKNIKLLFYIRIFVLISVFISLGFSVYFVSFEFCILAILSLCLIETMSNGTNIYKLFLEVRQLERGKK